MASRRLGGVTTQSRFLAVVLSGYVACELNIAWPRLTYLTLCVVAELRFRQTAEYQRGVR